MDFSKKRNHSKQEPNQPLHHHLNHALNNFQTHFSNIIHQIKPKLFNNNNPFCSLSSNYQNNIINNSQLALSTAEIKKRMGGIRVYKVSNYSENTCTLNSDDGDKSIELYYFSEQDAHAFLQQIDKFSAKLHPHDCRILDTPLTQLLDSEAIETPIRLVPEMSQVKNAIKETKKNASFSGVPLFQSKYLQVDDLKGKKYRPAFLRREDLEYNRSAILTPGHIKKDVIKVTALEDIIQEMKDSSTSKSNDILILGPGMSRTWFHEQNQME